MNRKIGLVITLTVLMVSGLSLFLRVSGRLHFHPLRVCLTPIPSAATIVAAIRSGPGDGGPGVGNDGRNYTVRPLTCPQAVGVGTPKIDLWLRVAAQEQLLDEGVLRVGIISADRVVLFGFHSQMGKTDTFRVVGQKNNSQ
jgi:hypothetical protein